MQSAYNFAYIAQATPATPPIVMVTAFNVLLYLGIDLGMAVNLVFVLPIIGNEFFIAFWLMIKGVDTSSIIQS